jgi:hypothetical protein
MNEFAVLTTGKPCGFWTGPYKKILRWKETDFSLVDCPSRLRVNKHSPHPEWTGCPSRLRVNRHSP